MTPGQSRARHLRACWSRSSALAALAAVAFIGACAPRFAAERWVLGDRVVQTGGIEYGANDRQELDVYRPFGRASPAPVVIFLYGGRWKYGSRRDYLLVGNRFARRGWITVIPDYRLFPQTLFPGWVEDAASVARWTVDNIAAFGGDTSRIFIVGHSAGGHTAALLALDERYLREAGVVPGSIAGFVSIAGPVDTTWTAPDVQRLMGPPAGWPVSYPSTHIDGTETRLLLMHGDADDVVTVGNSIRLAERIEARGGCARVRIYPAVGHVDIAIALGLPSLVQAPVLDDLASFMDATPNGRCHAEAPPRQ